MNIWRHAFARLSPSGARARLSVLIFHRVLPTIDPLFPEIPDSARFERMMCWIADWFNVLPLSEAVERLGSESLPERSLCITFDDGYADNATVAAPILRRLGLPATFFVASGMLDGGRMWNDTVIEALRGCPLALLDLAALGLGTFELSDEIHRRHAIDAILAATKRLPYDQRRRVVDRIADAASAALPVGLMMSSEQLRALAAAGIEVGAHTVTHPILACLDDAEAYNEIARGRDDLQQRIGAPVRLFAYPNGVRDFDYDARHVEMARRSGFHAAFTTAWGISTSRSDRFQLPRFTPWDRSRIGYGMRLMRNLYLDHNAAA
jgi:peptidoglycan/xylan/chitin deacetylase (PgdA/CDA1 family)